MRLSILSQGSKASCSSWCPRAWPSTCRRVWMVLDALPSTVSSTSGSLLLQSTMLPDSSDLRVKSRLLSTKRTHIFALAQRMPPTLNQCSESQTIPKPNSQVAFERLYYLKLELRTNKTFWMRHYHQLTACHGLYQHDQGHYSSPQLSRNESDTFGTKFGAKRAP